MLKKNVIYVSVLIFITLCLTLLPIIKIPIYTSSRGIILPLEVNTKLNGIISGRIIYTSLVKNNQFINKGDTLLVINSEQLDSQKQLKEQQIKDYHEQLRDLDLLISGNYNRLKTNLFQKEYNYFHQQIQELNTRFNKLKNDHKRNQTLFKKGVIAEIDYEKSKYEYDLVKNSISQLNRKQRSTWQTQKQEIDEHLKALISEATRIDQEQNNYAITAPISGRLVNFSGLQKGNFYVQGQIFGGEISPEKPLVAECTVSSNDIGFIHIGQKVRFQIDAYNYNKWGFLEADVIDIDQNIITNQQTGEIYFSVVCHMDRNYLQLKNGYRVNVSKGDDFYSSFLFS
ncbi:HlyD family secretion protein [Algibacter lectus]|uniref:HlyD family secretion protein n=1 Tax=Algibacter lectus TaxID=221126 RepID=A0A090WM35_9FLAO|nr:HlyD family efflux transporter periplasmic adaptor subunit [Algibacter lectus]GAL77278.1 HlyD family secretion protein [Algibacter lectus]